MTTIPDLRKILYVEDEPDIQEIARLALELAGGFEVEVGGRRFVWRRYSSRTSSSSTS